MTLKERLEDAAAANVAPGHTVAACIDSADARALLAVIAAAADLAAAVRLMDLYPPLIVPLSRTEAGLRSVGG